MAIARRSAITIADDILINLFCVAYTMGKLNDSMNSFEDRILANEMLTAFLDVPKIDELGRVKQDYSKAEAHINFGQSYRTDKACKEILYIAAELKSKLIEAVNNVTVRLWVRHGRGDRSFAPPGPRFCRSYVEKGRRQSKYFGMTELDWPVRRFMRVRGNLVLFSAFRTTFRLAPRSAADQISLAAD